MPPSLCREVYIISPSSALRKDMKNSVKQVQTKHKENRRVYELGTLLFLYNVSKIFPTTITLTSAISA